MNTAKKVIIFGDDPRGPTGFGRIVDHLVDAVSSAGCIPIVVGLKSVYPSEYGKAVVHNVLDQSDPQGWRVLENVLTSEHADAVISVGDPWDLQGLVDIKNRIPFFWIGYTPVESPPFSRYILLVHSPPQYLDAAYLLRNMDLVVTYSDFGRKAVMEMMEQAFQGSGTALPRVTSIYLGVDTDTFSPEDRVESREVFGGSVGSDSLLFSCVKVNSMRAGFDTLLEAWAKYMGKAEKAVPDLAEKSKLYLHTNIEGSGYLLHVIMDRYGIGDSVLLNPSIRPGKGFPEKDMVDMYNSTDIAVSAVRGEGFGLNILESMSCGVPCIVPDWGCPPEYGGGALQKVPIAATYNPDFAATDFAIVDTDKMSDAMLELAMDPERRKAMGDEGRRIALSMAWEGFVENWKDLLREYLDLSENRPAL